MLNGIISEAVLGDAYGMSHMIYCVAQGMDAVKVGNQLTYDNMGLLCIGDWHADAPSDKVKAVEAFFKSVQILMKLTSICAIASGVNSCSTSASTKPLPSMKIRIKSFKKAVPAETQ